MKEKSFMSLILNSILNNKNILLLKFLIQIALLVAAVVVAGRKKLRVNFLKFLEAWKYIRWWKGIQRNLSVRNFSSFRKLQYYLLVGVVVVAEIK